MQTSELINFGSKILRKNTNSHRIDAEIILSHILKISREKILISENQVSKTNISKFKHLINRRLCNEPIAYILNKKEFRSKDFFVDKKSLIPRPETELIIDPIVKDFKNKSLFFLDIGVGSGCIISSILKELSHSKGVGVDICKDTILNAKINLINLKVQNRARLLNRSFKNIFNHKFDLIVSNPPYIARHQLKNLDIGIKKFEPKLALEIGRGQYFSVVKFLKENGFRKSRIIKDYKNNVRCIFSTLLKNKTK